MMSTLLCVSLAVGAAPRELQTMFPKRAQVTTNADGAGWVRLPLTTAVLQQVQPDLSDVRLLDAQGAVVPFVVQRHEQARIASTWAALDVTRTSRKRTAGAQQADDDTFDESYTAALPRGATGTATLEFRTGLSQYVRQVSVELVTDEGQVSRVSGQIFKLYDSGATRTELALGTLPARAKTVQVRIVGQGGDFLTPRISVNIKVPSAETATLRWAIEARPTHENKTTRWHVERPEGFVPARIELQTSTQWFNRALVVQSSRTQVAAGRVLRLPGATPIELLSLDLPPNTDEAFDIIVRDEDSEPLEQPTLAWVIEQPELVFVRQAHQSPLWLYFGGHRTAPAHYDTEAFGVTRPDAPLDDSQPTSGLGVIEANPTFSAASPLASFAHPAAAVEVTHFSSQARLPAWSKDQEVVTIFVSPRHAATMAYDFHDLRLVDAQGLQWPYLLHTTRAREVVALSTPATEAGQTTYRFRAPGRVVGLTVVPAAGSGWFSRQASLQFIPEASGRAPWQTAQGLLTFNPTERGEATVLSLALDDQPRGVGEWALTLVDGSDAPLSGLTVDVEYVVPSLVTIAPTGSYRLLWASLDAPRATYDLARLEPVISQMKSAAVQAQPAEANPDYVPPSLLERTGGAGRWVFWATLVLGALVLSGLVVKVARQQPTAD